MSWLGRCVQAVGLLVVGVVLADVFLTVLFPASGRGPIRRPLSRWSWRLFALVGRRLGTVRRRRFLAYSGPTQIASTVVVWVVLLAVGWSLVFQPALGTGVLSARGPTDTGWSTALYLSGFSLTTLGTGDVVPVSAAYRLLSVTEAAVGFSVFTLALTYFLSVYGAITSRRTFASTLSARTYGTGASVQLVVGLAADGDASAARERLSELAASLTHTLETHRSYPVLRYFHFREARYALPHMLLLALDAAALLANALDVERYRGLVRSPSLFELSAAANELLHDLVPESPGPPPSPAGVQEWEHHFVQAVGELRGAGLEVVRDPVAGARAYAALRGRWDGPLRALTRAMLYDWGEIEPAG